MVQEYLPYYKHKKDEDSFFKTKKGKKKQKKKANFFSLFINFQHKKKESTMETKQPKETNQTKETKQTLSRMMINCGCISEDIGAYTYQALLTTDLQRRDEYLQRVQELRKIFNDYCNY
jgi:hypothetical protein